MAELPLSTRTGSGTQSTTQSPQNSAGSTGAAANASGVQPGTAATLLTNKNGGVSLNNTAPTLVTIAPRTTATIVKAAPPLKHQTSPVVYGLASMLIILAIVMFVLALIPDKNTTD